MSEQQASIATFLLQVDEERARRLGDPELLATVQAVKRYQQQRFSRTYADMLSNSRYRGAARFFLDELYGPADFTRRDAQFLRVAPAIARLFPAELAHAVVVLAELHAISERLDSAMAHHLRKQKTIDAPAYISAWQATGQASQRELQIALTLEIGAILDRYTRKPLVRQTLRIMRGPAQAAGLGELQRFLEVGFDAFKAMKGAAEFLALVGQRERALAAALYSAGRVFDTTERGTNHGSANVLSQSLP